MIAPAIDDTAASKGGPVRSASERRPQPTVFVSALRLPPPNASKRRARGRPGRALLGAFAHTVRALRWLLVGLIGIYLGSGITRVAPNENALIYRFGRLQYEIHPPGLLFALPPPIDRVVKISTRTQKELLLSGWSPDENAALQIATANRNAMNSEPTGSSPVAGIEVHPGQLNPALLATFPKISSPSANTPTSGGLHPVFDGYTLTGDANILQSRFTVRYRIVDPFAFVSAAPETEAERLIEASVFDAATRAFAGTKIDDALGPGQDSLRQLILDLAQQRLDSMRLGIQITAFEINWLTPPLPTVASFAEVTSAQVEARTTMEQARTYRAQALPQAQGIAFRTHRQADADAFQLVARAKGEASSFDAILQEHREAPALLETRLRAETLEQVLPHVKFQTLLPADTQLSLFLRDSAK